jgi:fructokinase
MTPARPALLCFGEILWDFLPAGRFPGGAPFNVAYHLHRHGADVQVVSAVGRDLLGDELRQRLQDWGLPTADIARHPDLPTGRVRATVSAGGDASYDIVTGVAWDRITLTTDLLNRARHARGLIYGSLAQRSAHNQAVLAQLLAALPAKAWRIFDVNLRPPHDDLALVRRLATKATLLKLNAAEAARLVANQPESPGREEADARALASQTGCSIVCITAGARGAGLLRADRWHWEPGCPVTVADTVGAGDAFLAALVSSLMAGNHPDAASLARACRLGEWVASRPGATPDYDTAPAC